jgi:NADH dehydrogenase
MARGYLAPLMWRSLYKMHQRALYGRTKTARSSLARSVRSNTEPPMKLH